MLSGPFPQAPSPAVNTSVQNWISGCSLALYPPEVSGEARFLRQKTAVVVSGIADKRSVSVRRDRALQLRATRFVLLYC